MAATRGTYGGEAPLYYGERFDAEEAKVTGSAKTDEAAAEAEIAALFMNAKEAVATRDCSGAMGYM